MLHFYWIARKSAHHLVPVYGISLVRRKQNAKYIKYLSKFTSIIQNQDRKIKKRRENKALFLVRYLLNSPK